MIHIHIFYEYTSTVVLGQCCNARLCVTYFAISDVTGCVATPCSLSQLCIVVWENLTLKHGFEATKVTYCQNNRTV